eukprot:256314_1
MMERKSNLETITDGDKSIPDLVSSNNPKTRKTGSGVSDSSSRLKDVSVGVSTGQESEQRPTNRKAKRAHERAFWTLLRDSGWDPHTARRQNGRPRVCAHVKTSN